MQAIWLIAGAANGLLAVAAGAFGAHALANLPERYLNAFRTAAQYQMYHALALLILTLLPRAPLVQLAGYTFLAGILLFSGSLYALALSRQGWLGAVTPFGGVLLLAGWGALLAAGIRLLPLR